MSRDYRCGKWRILSRFDWLSHSRSLNLLDFILSYTSVMSLPLPSSSLGFDEWPHSQDTLDPLSILLHISSSAHPSFSINSVVAFNSTKSRFKQPPPPPAPRDKFRNCGANCIVLKLTPPYGKWRIQFITHYRKNTCLNIVFEILQFHPGPARKLSTNLYDIYHCWVYRE
jgi:hypothetical protein